MVKCPECGTDNIKPKRDWSYSAFNVEMYECNSCKKPFRAYYHKGKFSHTIPKGK